MSAVFHNDGAPVPCPLVTLFGAGNELPDGKELEALFDRFAVRFHVPYLLRETNMKAMLRAPDPVPSVTLDMPALEQAQWATAKVKVTDATVDALMAIRDACRVEGIVASDRRWKRSLKLAQASAYLAGEKQTGPEDLVILTDSLWREPKDRPKVARIVGKLSDPVAAQATEILDAARETAQKVVELQGGDSKAYISQAAQAIDAVLAAAATAGGPGEVRWERAKAAIAEANAEIHDARRTRAGGQRWPRPRGRAVKRIMYEVPRWDAFLHRLARGLDPAHDGDEPGQMLEDELFERLYDGEMQPLVEGEREPGWHPGQARSTRPASSCRRSSVWPPSAGATLTLRRQRSRSSSRS